MDNIFIKVSFIENLSKRPSKGQSLTLSLLSQSLPLVRADFCVVELITFKAFSLNNFPEYNTLLVIIITTLYIRSQNLFTLKLAVCTL